MQRMLRKRRGRTTLRISAVFFSVLFLSTQRCRERQGNTEEELLCVTLRSSFSALFFFNAELQRTQR